MLCPHTPGENSRAAAGRTILYGNFMVLTVLSVRHILLYGHRLLYPPDEVPLPPEDEDELLLPPYEDE